jgi:hypothetical protein
MTLIAAAAVTLVPFAAVVVLLLLARALEGRRAERMARQVAVTEAIHRELGAVVAPTIDKPVLGPWRLRIPVPLERPALVAGVLAAVRPALPGPVQIVLVPRPNAR